MKSSNSNKVTFDKIKVFRIRYHYRAEGKIPVSVEECSAIKVCKNRVLILDKHNCEFCKLNDDDNNSVFTSKQKAIKKAKDYLKAELRYKKDSLKLRIEGKKNEISSIKGLELELVEAIDMYKKYIKDFNRKR